LEHPQFGAIRVNMGEIVVILRGGRAACLARIPARQHCNGIPATYDRCCLCRSAGKEVGCHVLVRLWRYDQEGGPHPRLGALKLAIHNTVLCSDMGLNISPCGRFLALCTSVQVPTPLYPMPL
jgi:hypothetical protein